MKNGMEGARLDSETIASYEAAIMMGNRFNAERVSSQRRCWIGAGLLAIFLVLLGMASAPQLHQMIHPDANDAEHSCAVTVILTGGNEAPPSPQIVAAFIPAFVYLSNDFISVRPESFFLSCHIPDHAPPALS